MYRKFLAVKWRSPFPRSTYYKLSRNQTSFREINSLVVCRQNVEFVNTLSYLFLPDLTFLGESLSRNRCQGPVVVSHPGIRTVIGLTEGSQH